MVRRAAEAIIVADHTKFDQRALTVFAHWTDIDRSLPIGNRKERWQPPFAKPGRKPSLLNAEKGQAMARLTSLLPRDERSGFDDETEGLASQQARIGRLDLEFIRPDRSLARNWERVRNVHDASYLLVFRWREA